MRLDVLTIFPDYLRVLDLSLIGQAARSGTLDLAVHDLRDWAHDRHRTVDDTPLGGGAGMVMRPDVWGEALDSGLARAAAPAAAPTPPGDDGAGAPGAAAAGPAPAPRDDDRTVLVIPTPSGDLFTQRVAQDLAGADHLIIACGRYEGIDARVAEHYRSAGRQVRELSIGDYILNGGEAAALVIIEAVARLLPGVLGNPASVVEESHSEAGLLEYPVYTRPVAWRGHDLAAGEPVLLTGNHARIARHRRDQAIARTAARRPDMVRALDPSTLDGADRAALARSGWALPEGAAGPLPLRLRRAVDADLPAIVELAARTFPDACPAFLSPTAIAEHVAANLTLDRFATWLHDPRVTLTVADLPEGAPGIEAGAVVGYSVLLLERPDDDGAPPIGLDPRPTGVEAGGQGALAAELSKVYVDMRLRGSGAAAALLTGAIEQAADAGVTTLWLGTHAGNKRAQKAYKRAGFRQVGTRTYDVGGQTCRDVVMALDPQEC